MRIKKKQLFYKPTSFMFKKMRIVLICIYDVVCGYIHIHIHTLGKSCSTIDNTPVDVYDTSSIVWKNRRGVGKFCQYRRSKWKTGCSQIP
jgi:hypothetical protein